MRVVPSSSLSLLQPLASARNKCRLKSDNRSGTLMIIASVSLLHVRISTSAWVESASRLRYDCLNRAPSAPMVPPAENDSQISLQHANICKNKPSYGTIQLMVMIIVTNIIIQSVTTFSPSLSLSYLPRSPTCQLDFLAVGNRPRKRAQFHTPEFDLSS